MATHSSILALEILWTEGPGGLQSMGLQKNWIQSNGQGTVACDGQGSILDLVTEWCCHLSA